VVDFRRHFELPGSDLQYLERRGLPWEAVLDGNVRWVILHEHPVPTGYNYTAASTALQLSASYPDTQIDMVYFYPHLSRANGRPVPRLSNHSFDGKTWQRWSRHRTPANPWRRGYDCIETHILLVDEWLEREIRRAA
jgi:Prokaryotic E2 family E